MTTWVPIGPDFVFTPRDINFKRLSRRNELERQGLVNGIAIDPNDASTIYTAETPTSGGNAAFRTDDGGSSWTSMMDSLQQADPAGVNPSCVGHHASISGVIFVGTFSGRLYRSTTRGASWSATPFDFGGGSVFKIVADPRNATDPMTTTVYVGCSNGVWMSTDGGATFKLVKGGNCAALAARIPTDGSAADFYAGISGVGIFHTTNPSGAWTNLNTTAGTNLPAAGTPSSAQPSGNFDAIRIDVCRLTPRVYAWFFNTVCGSGGCVEGNASPNTLFTAPNATSAWTAISMTSPPTPAYGLYDSALAVAANSPGDGAKDILFFGSIHLFRSLNSGQTWVDMNSDEVHDDYHAFAFFPDPPPPGIIPATYVGCDGGLGLSTGLADPTYTPPGDFDQTDVVTPSGAVQNLNHGKQSTAVYGYNSHPGIPALGYVGVQDTGMHAGDSSLLWRGLANLDGGSVACVAGPDGVKVWFTINGGFFMITDKGDFSPIWANVVLGASGPGIVGTSNFHVAPNGSCLAGINPQFPTTTVAAAIASGIQAVTPASMANIAVGTVLKIDPNGKTQEVVTVTATTATTFTANFATAHGSGITVRLEVRRLGVIDQTAIARPIGPDLGLQSVQLVAVNPANGDLVCFGTTDQKFYLSNNATAASPTWTQIVTNQPTGSSFSSVEIDRLGNAYVLLARSITSGVGELSTTSPLFLVTASGWTQCTFTSLPADAAGGIGFTRLVADPVQANTLYAGHDAAVLKFTSSNTTGPFTSTDISTGLPGQWIYGLWIGNIGTSDAPKVLLRAAVPCRGIWETDVTKDVGTKASELYIRDNVMDMGRLPTSPDGILNPYDPSNRLYHYQCADIKIDALQLGNPNFFQTDPEGTLPLSHVLFDQLLDNSQHLPSADQAMVHVQVRNRSTAPLKNVRVWAIYCNASAGVPSLSASVSAGNNFPFWSQFQVTGQIVPTLPGDSPWRSVGSPITLQPVDAANPQVASWTWAVPTLSPGDPGHYCMVAFVHHSSSLLTASSFNVDAIVPGNKQIGQKNLHIGPPLSNTGMKRRMLEYIEFHNPTGEPREVTLVFDTHTLPPELRTFFVLTTLDTLQPLPSSITGVTNTNGQPTGGGLGSGMLGWFLDFCCCGNLFNLAEDEAIESVGTLTKRAAHLRETHHHEPRRCHMPQPVQFEPPVYQVVPSTKAEVGGVRIPPYGFVASILSVEVRGQLPPGSQYTFHIQQVVDERVVGGSAYVVRIAGDRPPPQSNQPDQEAQGWVPPYAMDQIDQRGASLGKVDPK